jgi:two-component system chemotaxis response regulator CheB
MASRYTHDLIVIGTSMGGVEALSRLVAQLPRDLQASICVVLHLAPGHLSVLPDILSRAGPLPAHHPMDGEPLEYSHIYVAPSDRHLLVEPGYLRVVKGPLENGHRPAVDPLFRSAARAYGPRVVGVVLTGARNCGSAGLLAIKAQGGIAVVQDPQDAACAEMPRNALEYVEVDHCPRLSRMGALLSRLSAQPVRGPRKRPRAGLQHEVQLSLGASEAANQPPDRGHPSHYSCPDCGGVLFELEDSGLLRFRCRVGHGFTDEALADGQEKKVDEALWAAVRALEENAAVARRLESRARERNHRLSAKRYEERAIAAEQQARAVRQVALTGSVQDPSSALAEEGEPHPSH